MNIKLMNIDEQIELLKAFKAGKEIQQRLSYGDVPWEKAYDASLWSFASYDYRVKPEPREWRVWRHNISGDITSRTPFDQDSGYTTFKVREVLP